MQGTLPGRASYRMARRRRATPERGFKAGGRSSRGEKMKDSKDVFRIVAMVLLGLFALTVVLPIVLSALGFVVVTVVTLAVGLIKIAVVLAVIYLILAGVRAVLK